MDKVTKKRNKKREKAAFEKNTFHLEHDKKKRVNFNGEALFFTLQKEF